jgi:phosphoribosylformylglycinamidine cyclo-ligase
MQDPLLVTSTDGVGTKVLLGLEQNALEGLGIDLVAMCVNDLYCVGGRPLFFLDYYATGVLDDAQFKSVLTGIKRGLAPCGAALMGGETAELPGLYEKGHFDLAGFVVGVVDGKQMLGEGRVQAGDILFALPSSGFHSNGYSLVRHWLKQKPVDTATMQKILAPTRVYHEIPELLSKVGPSVFHALANITGGGISGNLPRVMPAGAVCKIRSQDIPTPPWMKQFIEGNGSTVMANEAVFNLGAGMIASVAAAQSDAFAAAARAMKLDVVPIGTVDLTGGRDEARVVFQ